MNVRLYRAVCEVEFADIIATGQFSLVSNALEGKWFAESFEDARKWGEAFYRLSGTRQDKIIMAEFGRDAADRFFRVSMLDGIGPARFATVAELSSMLLSVREAMP